MLHVQVSIQDLPSSSIGKTKWEFLFTWKCPVPPSVKLFAYLMLHDKILLRVVLNKRGVLVDLRCALWEACERETTLHLLFICPFATAVWRKESNIIGAKIMVPAECRDNSRGMDRFLGGSGYESQGMGS